MTKDEYTNFTEKIPSPREMFNLLKELAVKCKLLETEVTLLKQHVNIKQRKHILDWLNLNKQNSVSFHEWYNSIKVDVNGLSKVFESNLTEGIKYIIKYSLLSDCKPLYAFTQKANYIYVYDDCPDENKQSWMHFTSPQCEKLVQYISRQLLVEFIKWQKENQHLIVDNEMMKDKEIEYMVKINGSKISLEKRTAEIKKWMFSILQEEFVII
jgi:hypothetical protein